MITFKPMHQRSNLHVANVWTTTATPFVLHQCTAVIPISADYQIKTFKCTRLLPMVNLLHTTLTDALLLLKQQIIVRN